MYIEPNIPILKKTMIISSIVLCMVFLVAFFFASPKTKENKSDVVGISGTLSKEDGVFLVNGQTVIRTQQPLDGLVGQSVAVVGILDAQGILHIEQLVVAPEKELISEPQTQQIRRATARSDVSFTLAIPNGWTMRDESKKDASTIIIEREENTIELHRAQTFESMTYAEVESHTITISGFDYHKKRVIFEKNNRLSDLIEPTDECLKDVSCPRFWAVNYTTTPDTSAVFDNVLASVKWLPEPQGWKLLNVIMSGSDWNMKLLYPDDMQMTQSDAIYTITQADIPEITIESRTNISREKDTWGGLSRTSVQLPTREETIFTQPDGSYAMILIAPDEIGEVKIIGSGPTFEAIIRTIVFEKKQKKDNM